MSSSCFLPKNKSLIIRLARSTNQSPVFWLETAWTHVLTRISEKNDFSTLSFSHFSMKSFSRHFPWNWFYGKKWNYNIYLPIPLSSRAQVFITFKYIWLVFQRDFKESAWWSANDTFFPNLMINPSKVVSPPKTDFNTFVNEVLTCINVWWVVSINIDTRSQPCTVSWDICFIRVSLCGRNKLGICNIYKVL